MLLPSFRGSWRLCHPMETNARLTGNGVDAVFVFLLQNVGNTYLKPTFCNTGMTKTDELLALVRRQGVLRPRDLDAHGIPRMYLVRLHRDGVLDRPSRGVYVLADAEATEHHSLAEACKRVPHGVVCLLSALQFHGL